MCINKIIAGGTSAVFVRAMDKIRKTNVNSREKFELGADRGRDRLKRKREMMGEEEACKMRENNRE